jgi:hypothetical protein
MDYQSRVGAIIRKRRSLVQSSGAPKIDTFVSVTRNSKETLFDLACVTVLNDIFFILLFRP